MSVKKGPTSWTWPISPHGLEQGYEFEASFGYIVSKRETAMVSSTCLHTLSQKACPNTLSQVHCLKKLGCWRDGHGQQRLPLFQRIRALFSAAAPQLTTACKASSQGSEALVQPHARTHTQTQIKSFARKRLSLKSYTHTHTHTLIHKYR